MKKTKLTALLSALLLAVSCMMFVGCDNNKPDDENNPPPQPQPPAEYTVTFDYLADGMESFTVTVTENDKAVKPAPDPSRDGYTFGGWYSDEDCVYEFDFDKGITSDITAYAKWTDNAKNYYTVSFNLNYTGAPEAPTASVEEGTVASAPAAPRYSDGSMEFTGWYTSATGGEKFDFATVINSDTAVYAQWAQTTDYVFEAEYTYVLSLKGKGYSSNTSGVGLIAPDGDGIIGKEGPAKASNGFYISYFYVKDQSLTFKIDSDREVEHSFLSMRLSGELVPTIMLTDEEWLVKVNGEKMEYGSITIDNIDTDMSKEDKREFQDFVVTTDLHLVKGENVITLTVNNGRKMQGTIGCTAPLIDCIKITSSADLTWDPQLSNLSRFE